MVFVILAILPIIILWTPLGAKLGFKSDSSERATNEKTTINLEATKFKDSDGDGLTDYLEIEIYHTNPNKKDTDDDGFNDNDEISLGFSPLSETKSKSDTDQDGLLNYQEIFVYFTDPNNKDTDGDGVFDGLEIVMGTNPLDKADYQGQFVSAKVLKEGKGDNSIINEDPFSIIIPKIDVEAPIVWTQAPDNNTILEDLKRGVTHAFKTSLPGSGNGNGVYFGHSSGYWWGPHNGAYDTIFATIDQLNEEDEIYLENPTRRYKYKVVKKEVTTPDDEDIFAETEKESITLVTCYPLGTALKRLYVRAEIDQEL